MTREKVRDWKPRYTHRSTLGRVSQELFIETIPTPSQIELGKQNTARNVCGEVTRGG